EPCLAAESTRHICLGHLPSTADDASGTSRSDPLPAQATRRGIAAMVRAHAGDARPEARVRRVSAAPSGRCRPTTLASRLRLLGRRRRRRAYFCKQVMPARPDPALIPVRTLIASTRSFSVFTVSLVGFELGVEFFMEHLVLVDCSWVRTTGDTLESHSA